MADATAEPHAPETADPYIWKPAGAFGLQAVHPRQSAPDHTPKPNIKPQPMAEAQEAYEALWRWRDFFAGFTVGAISILTVSLFYRLERR